MIRPLTPARCRHALAGWLLASVACTAQAQTVPAEWPLEVPGATMALVLPSQQTVFARAAEAVRQGFFAAYEASSKTAMAIQVVEVDDDPEQLYAALAAAQQRGVKVVVGPLPRAAVNALVDGGRVSLPMVALNFPERDAAAPVTLIALGLSAEAEATHVVRLAMSELVGTRPATAGARFVVLAGQAPLERRIGQAYVSALRALGEPPLVLEVTPESRDQLAHRIDAKRHEAVFLALDAQQTALVRARIPRSILTFGTSLLNVGGASGSPETVALAHDLDGVRFVDMPWLLRADGTPAGGPVPAVPLATDLARLFALGVDAYQVALRWSRGETQFAFDGMTGRLRVDRAQGPRVERTPAAAIYRNGAIEREQIGR